MASKGIDVSHWQGTNIDWNAVKASGVSYAYLKASEGVATLDSAFVTNFKNAKAAGILVGAYHFAHANQDVTANAVNFLNALKQTGLGDLDLVIDIEQTDGLTGGFDTWTDKFIANVQAQSGREVAIYSGSWFADTYLASIENKYKLWIAKYGTAAPTEKNVVLWQSSQSGHVPGIAGNVDLDQGEPPQPPQHVLTTASAYSVVVNDTVYDAFAYQGDTYVLWTALNEYNTPHVYKGDGLMSVNGVDVQGYIYNGNTYLPWTAIAQGIQATPVQWFFHK